MCKDVSTRDKHKLHITRHDVIMTNVFDCVRMLSNHPRSSKLPAVPVPCELSAAPTETPAMETGVAVAPLSRRCKGITQIHHPITMKAKLLIH